MSGLGPRRPRDKRDEPVTPPTPTPTPTPAPTEPEGNEG